MRSPNRNRSNNRSTALCALSLFFAVFLLAAPAAANSADFTVSQDGTMLFVEAELINADSYLLISSGLLGEDQPLENVQNLTLVSEDGMVVESKNTKGTLTFPEGNYSLSYSYPLSGGFVYAKFPDAYDVTVMLPAPYTTGNVILGTVSDGGVISKSDGDTIVTFNQTKVFSLTFYEENREPILYAFLGVWLVMFLFAFSKYRRVKKNRMKI